MSLYQEEIWSQTNGLLLPFGGRIEHRMGAAAQATHLPRPWSMKQGFLLDMHVLHFHG